MKRYCKLLPFCVLFINVHNLISQNNLDLKPLQCETDTFYGKVYKDPYRFLENIQDTIVIEWLNQQTSYATAILHKITNRETILTRQKKDLGNGARANYLKIAGNNQSFYLKQEPYEKGYKLYYRNGLHGKEELLFNPENYKKDSKVRYLISYIKPSWDASKIVIGLTIKDEEFSELVVLDVKSKKLHDEIITNCWPKALGGVSWLNDNSGFFYTHIPVMDKSSESYILNTASVLYRLGDNPKELNVILSAKNNPDIGIKPADFPIIYTKPYYGDILIAGIEGVGPFSDHYYTKVTNKIEEVRWKPLFKKEDKVKQFTFYRGEIYFLSALNSPNYKLCKTNINNPNFKNPEILVAEDTNDVITDFEITKSGVYFVKNKNGVDAQLYLLKDQKEQKIPIPRPSGYIDIRPKSPDSDDFWIVIRGWTIYGERYRYNSEEKIFIEDDFYPPPKYQELDSVIVEEIEIASHDGVMVPFSIIYKNGTQLNGKNRVLIGGYGAYGYTNRPNLNSYLLQWVREGGIYAIAHVRGGGEKGNKWHKGGFKQTKPNTWKDFIACTEYLIKKKYTVPDKIAIWGGSAGGILIARAITERPDLYKAAILSAASINMLRTEFGPNGKNNIKEFGSVEDSTEFLALLEMDACQHIKAGTKYPAVLLQAGANDSRVPFWESAKFAAGLQEANVSDNPILLSIDLDSGHGFNMSTDQWDQKVADVISFALWQTGHHDFQLKK